MPSDVNQTLEGAARQPAFAARLFARVRLFARARLFAHGRLSLRIRLLAGIGLVIALIVAGVLATIHVGLGAVFRDEARERLRQVVDIAVVLAGQSGEHLIWYGDQRAMPLDDQFLGRLAEVTGATINLRINGAFVASSRRDADGQPALVPAGEAALPASGDSVLSLPAFREQGIGQGAQRAPWYVYTDPVFDRSGRMVGRLTVLGPAENFSAWASAVTWRLAALSAPVPVVLIGLLWLALRRVFGRFERVRGALVALSDGRLDTVVPELGSGDEVGAMAGAAERYKRSSLRLAELERERERAMVEERERGLQARHLADHDTLTGLANRRKLADVLAGRLEAAAPGCLLLLDLDHFKEVNDTLGHAMGDALLSAVALRIAAQVGEECLVARFGGDEFAVLAPLAGDEAIEELARHLVETLSRPIAVGDQWLRVATSIGSTAFPADGNGVEVVLSNADIAMYQAKAAGRSTHRRYDPDHRGDLARRKLLLDRLRDAVEASQLTVHYQPKISLATGAVIGTEALVRWQDGEHGWISPAEFIPLAEQSGLIGLIGEQVLRRSCLDAVRWNTVVRDPVPVAVNLSVVQLRDPGFVDKVEAVLKESGLTPDLLELEITESAVMDDVEAVIAIFERITALGIALSIDDFGTGYSSLSYLRRFRVSKIKIDRSFVTDLSSSLDARAIAAGIIGLGASLGLKIVAEGVEDTEQLEILTGLGCDEGQGWLFTKALPLDSHIAFLRNRQLPGQRLGDWRAG